MATRFVNVDRATAMLLPPDLEEWVAKDDLVRFIIDAVETCDLSLAKINVRGSGSAQYPPGMMLSLLIYCYANRLFSSRQIEAATYSHVSVRYLCANEHPDHDTIAAFRRANGALLQNCFVAVLQLAKELKAFDRLGTVSVDGTKLGARASRQSNRRLGELEAELAELQTEIKELLAQAEAADVTEAGRGERLAPELHEKQARQAALQAAKAQLQARQRASREQRRQQARGADPEEPEDPEDPSPPSCRPRGAASTTEPAAAEADTPAKRDAQRTINLVEPESRLLRDAHGVYLQGYNAQIAVEAGTESRSQLIVGVHLSQDANDRQVLAESVAHIPPVFREEIQHLLLDTGYDNADLNTRVEQQLGVTVLCPPQSAQAPPQKDYRLTRTQQRRRAYAQAMRERLAQPEGKQLYRRRAASVEPVFGVLKNALGFRRFRLFGLVKATLEFTLLAVAYNLRRLAQMVGGRPAASA
jgi:transposase